MRHRLPVLITLAASLAGLAAGGCGASGGSSPPADARLAPMAPVAPMPWTPVPAVELSNLAGGTAGVTRLAEGRVALVSMWATWCDACMKELDALNRLHASTAAGRDAVVIGVDVGEDPDTVAAFAKQRGLRYAQLVDRDFVFADALGQRRVPATLVVDRQGRIVYRGDALDARSLEALRRAIGGDQASSRSVYPSGATAR
jgi:thiol-disulfide isomerase/thioredoxin